MRIFLTILLELERARKPGPNANAGPSLHKPRARAQFSTKLGKALNLKVTLIWFFDVVLERAQAQAHRPGLNAGPAVYKPKARKSSGPICSEARGLDYKDSY